MAIDRDRYERVRKVQQEMCEFTGLIDSLGFNDLDQCYDTIDAILDGMPRFAEVLTDFKRSEYYANREKFNTYVNENFHPLDFSDDMTSLKRKIMQASAMLSHMEKLRPTD